MKSNDTNLLIILILILIIFVIIFNIDKNKLNSREKFLINIYDDTKYENYIKSESLSDLIAPCKKGSGQKEAIIHRFTKCRLGKKENYFNCINDIEVDTSCL